MEFVIFALLKFTKNPKPSDFAAIEEQQALSWGAVAASSAAPGQDGSSWAQHPRIQADLIPWEGGRRRNSQLGGTLRGHGANPFRCHLGFFPGVPESCWEFSILRAELSLLSALGLFPGFEQLLPAPLEQAS